MFILYVHIAKYMMKESVVYKRFAVATTLKVRERECSK